VAQVGEVDQLVHQLKAPGDGLVDLGRRPDAMAERVRTASVARALRWLAAARAK